jgi:S-formylglutathione hydrolase FrmB
VIRAAWLGVGLLIVSAGPLRASQLFNLHRLDRVNREICGHIVDHTQNHGADRRIWSSALCQKRDLYVYLPPRYDPSRRYPLMIWLHGFAQDEQAFLYDVAVPLDRAMACGKLAPMIMVAPDGSFKGNPCLVEAGSFFLNSKAGRYEDFLMKDVWEFVHRHYPICPEREAHGISGVSMGGGTAFNVGFKYRHCFKVIAGCFPPVNPRWMDCHGNAMANFNPCCWGWRTDYSRPYEVVGRFGIVAVRMKQVADPLYGRGPHTAHCVSRENPAELLDRLEIQPGEFCIFLAYGGKDQFNIDAQCESFIYLARKRGICMTVCHDPKGTHSRATGESFRPAVIEWLSKQMAAYNH